MHEQFGPDITSFFFRCSCSCFCSCFFVDAFSCVSSPDRGAGGDFVSATETVTVTVTVAVTVTVTVSANETRIDRGDGRKTPPSSFCGGAKRRTKRMGSGSSLVCQSGL